MRLGIIQGRAIATAGLLACLWTPLLGAQHSVRTDSALIASIDSLVRAEMGRSAAPGVQLTVRWKGRAILDKGYGLASLSPSSPMTAATIVPIGSITKTFTSAVVLQLVASGELELDQTIASYFPGRDFDQRITLRQLLNHTAGLRPYETLIPDVGAFARTAVRADTILSFVSGAAVNHTPGARFEYVNTGYHLLGLIIERVTGRDYFAVVVSELVSKSNLRVVGPCDSLSGVAVAFERERNGVERVTLPTSRFSFSAGGLCSTSSDVATFLEKIPVLLGAELNDVMLQDTKLANGPPNSYGLGVSTGDLEGHKWFGHGGSLPGIDTFAARYPSDDLTVVVAANIRPFDSETLQKRIARQILGIGEVKVADLPLSDTRRSEYVGSYSMAGRGLRVVDAKGRLAVVGPGDFTLAFQGNDLFVAREDPDIRVQFVRKEGRVSGMLWTAPGRRIELQRAP
jgi:CubicO group peptidase (beta-lactamase class C family)